MQNNFKIYINDIRHLPKMNRFFRKKITTVLEPVLPNFLVRTICIRTRLGQLGKTLFLIRGILLYGSML